MVSRVLERRAIAQCVQQHRALCAIPTVASLFSFLLFFFKDMSVFSFALVSLLSFRKSGKIYPTLIRSPVHNGRPFSSSSETMESVALRPDFLLVRLLSSTFCLYFSFLLEPCIIGLLLVCVSRFSIYILCGLGLSVWTLKSDTNSELFRLYLASTSIKESLILIDCLMAKMIHLKKLWTRTTNAGILRCNYVENQMSFEGTFWDIEIIKRI